MWALCRKESCCEQYTLLTRPRIAFIILVKFNWLELRQKLGPSGLQSEVHNSRGHTVHQGTGRRYYETSISIYFYYILLTFLFLCMFIMYIIPIYYTYMCIHYWQIYKYIYKYIYMTNIQVYIYVYTNICIYK